MVENPGIIGLNLSNTLYPTEKDLNDSFESKGLTRHHTDSDGRNFQWKTLISERERRLTDTVRETRQTL